MKELIRELVNLADVLEDVHYNLDLRNHQRFPFFIEKKLFEVFFSQSVINVSIRKNFYNVGTNVKQGTLFSLKEYANEKALEVYDGSNHYAYNNLFDEPNVLECYEPYTKVPLDLNNIDPDFQFQLSTLLPDGHDKVLNYMKEIYPSDLMGTSFNGVVISTGFTIDEVQRLIEVLTKLGSIHAF